MDFLAANDVRNCILSDCAVRIETGSSFSLSVVCLSSVSSKLGWLSGRGVQWQAGLAADEGHNWLRRYVHMKKAGVSGFPYCYNGF